MKKYIFILLTAIFCLPAFAIEEPMPILQKAQPITEANLPLSQYYNIDFYSLTSSFYPIEKDVYRELTRFEKKKYQECLKLEKLISKNKFAKAIKIERDYLPIYFKAYQYNYNRNDNVYIINNLNSILDIMNRYNFSIDDPRYEAIKGNLAFYYYVNGEYNESISLFEKLNKKECDFYNLMLAENYYKLNNYEKSFYYANKVKNESKKEDYTYCRALEFKFLYYVNKKKIELANKISYELAKHNFPDSYTAYKRVADTTYNIETKIKYYSYAKEHANNIAEKKQINNILSNIYQKKIDNASKSIKGFFVKPSWDEIYTRDKNLMSFEVENERFNKFYKNVNDCINKYSGNDLKACFNKINNDEEKYSNRLTLERQETIRSMEEQEKIRQMRLINANIIEANYLQRQQNYILNRPRYYNSTTTNFGNYSYTNGFSY